MLNGSFSAAAEFTLQSDIVSLLPTTLHAVQGNTETCGKLGVPITISPTTYSLFFIKTGGESYIDLVDPLTVVIESEQSTVNVPGVVMCVLGGDSLPILVTSDNIPHTNITVGLTT